MLENILRKIARGVHAPCPWGWDNRYQSLLIVVAPVQARQVADNLNALFESCWVDEVSGGNASRTVRALDRFLSGIRSGQTLYCTLVNKTTLVYATLWPWNDQPMVSIRIGIFNMKEQHCGLSPQGVAILQEIFGVKVGE